MLNGLSLLSHVILINHFCNTATRYILLCSRIQAFSIWYLDWGHVEIGEAKGLCLFKMHYKDVVRIYPTLTTPCTNVCLEVGTIVQCWTLFLYDVFTVCVLFKLLVQIYRTILTISNIYFIGMRYSCPLDVPTLYFKHSCRGIFSFDSHIFKLF